MCPKCFVTKMTMTFVTGGGGSHQPDILLHQGNDLTEAVGELAVRLALVDVAVALAGAEEALVLPRGARQ